MIALRVLSDLRNLDREDERRIDRLLRASLAAYRAAGDRGGSPDPGVVVQTACAHLAAGEREEAYFALRAAQELAPALPDQRVRE